MSSTPAILTRLRVLQFETALEDAVKRHRPIDWIVAVTKKLRTAFHPGNILWTPHELMHSIEASCAYQRGHRREPVTESRLRQAINVFRQHESPYEEYLLEHLGDAQMFFLVIKRRQLELQATAYELHNGIGRFHALYGNMSSFESCINILADNFSLSVDQWATYCLGVFNQATEDPNCRFCLENYTATSRGFLTPSSLESFLQLSSRTTDQIGSQYKQERDNLRSNHLHVCLRSSFLDHPAIDFGNDRLICPRPILLIRHMHTGLERAIRQYDEDAWQRDNSICFEKYIAMLLENTFEPDSVIRPDLSWHSSGRKRCDILLDLIDCYWLIECKATRFTQRLLILEHLRNDSSSNRLREASAQLADTIGDLRNDRTPLKYHPKPIVAMIITQGDIFNPNRDWYWRNVICPKDDLHDIDFNLTSDILEFRPQILSITAFEMLIACIRLGNHSVLNIARDQVELLKDLTAGDWPAAVRKRFSDKEQTTINELESAYESYIDRISHHIPTR